MKITESQRENGKGILLSYITRHDLGFETPHSVLSDVGGSIFDDVIDNGE